MVRRSQPWAVRVLAFEERTRVANVFMLLVEIDLQKGVPRKHRAPRSTKAKARQRTNRKTKQAPAQQEPSDIIYVSNKTSRPASSIRTARRDLYLQDYYIQNSQIFLNWF